jgi:hypothetical protein
VKNKTAILTITIAICSMAGGYYLGSRPFFKKHFELVILAIVFLSVLPAVYHIIKARQAAKHGGDCLGSNGHVLHGLLALRHYSFALPTDADRRERQ